jgi:hypothetical protein
VSVPPSAVALVGQVKLTDRDELPETEQVEVAEAAIFPPLHLLFAFAVSVEVIEQALVTGTV